nr:hypothetical protein BCV29_18660 [Vibrio cyclitrophicus]
MNIVVVNYNNSQCTLDLIKSIEDKEIYINEFIVVDNSSSECEVDLLKENNTSLDVKFIFLEDNVGYFHGLNKGIDCLRSKEVYPTFIGNNDLIFSDDFFINFFNREYEADTLAVAPCFKTMDGVYQNPAQPKKPTRFKRVFYALYFFNYNVGSLIYKAWVMLGLSAQSSLSKDYDSRNIYLGMGAGYIILPRFFNEYKRLIYPNFLYGEEAFLSKQIEDANGCLFYDANLDILHLESVATAKLPSKDKYAMMKKSYLIYRDYF